ncbi:hypothetical protein [Acidiphilium acidophilum]|uniref:hypothetical protein n=1 Tax=Acidiphilium acidophilum TaxID=76588 RepID=UPI002E8E7195|nr:hypothetical protein [Acidiphilium acidophilum]
MTLLSDYPADNVVRFPVEMSHPDLDTLIAIEPDVLFVDELGGPVVTEPKVRFSRIPTTLEGWVIRG